MTDETQATAEPTPNVRPASPQAKLDALAAEKEALLAATDRPDFIDSNQIEADAQDEDEPNEEEVIDDELPEEEEPEELPTETEEEEEVATEPGTKPTQFRIRPKDDVEKRAFELRKRNLDMPLKDALAQAEKELGIATTATEPEQTAEQAAPLSVATLEAERDTLEGQIDEAEANMDFEQLPQLRKRLRAIERQELPQAREAHARQAEALNATYQKSADQASSLYPDATKKGSEFYQKMAEIDAALQASQDPLFTDHNKPLIIAQMAARELRVAPSTRPTKANTTPRYPPSLFRYRSCAARYVPAPSAQPLVCLAATLPYLLCHHVPCATYPCR